MADKPSTCPVCSKRLSKKQWYYRNGQYFDKRRCFYTAQEKAEQENAKAKEEAKAKAEEANAKDAQPQAAASEKTEAKADAKQKG